MNDNGKLDYLPLSFQQSALELNKRACGLPSFAK